jgi:hypothetical protein
LGVLTTSVPPQQPRPILKMFDQPEGTNDIVTSAKSMGEDIVADKFPHSISLAL